MNGFKPGEFGSSGSIKCTGIWKFFATSNILYVCSASGVNDAKPKFLYVIVPSGIVP